MRSTLLLVLLACAAASASASGQDDGFRPMQGPSYGGSSDSGNSWRSDEAQTGTGRSDGGSRGAVPTQAEAEAMQRAQQQQAGQQGGPGGQQGGPPVQKRQDRGNGENGSNGPGDANGPGDGDSGGPQDSSAVDLDAARANFPTVAENYVAKRSAKGYWTYVARKGAKPRRLADPKVDEGSVRPVRGERFSARVRLRDKGGGKPVVLEFEADFSGTNWKVVAVRPAALSSRR
ncbi:MAG TPA: hypothetical protein VN915_09340 [Elusimicrobiota bacterium]|nr:hypothetical protein [Elusimicrobiota bacterium]